MAKAATKWSRKIRLGTFIQADNFIHVLRGIDCLTVTLIGLLFYAFRWRPTITENYMLNLGSLIFAPIKCAIS